MTEDILEAEVWNIKHKELAGESIQINILLVCSKHRILSSFSNSLLIFHSNMLHVKVEICIKHALKAQIISL